MVTIIIWKNNCRNIRQIPIRSSIFILTRGLIPIQSHRIPPSLFPPPIFLVSNSSDGGCQHPQPGTSSKRFHNYQRLPSLLLIFPLCHIFGFVGFIIALPQFGVVQRFGGLNYLIPLIVILFFWGLTPSPPSPFTHIPPPLKPQELSCHPQVLRVFVGTGNGGRGQGVWSQEEK